MRSYVSFLKVLYDNWWSGNFVPKYYSGDFWHNAAEFLINDNCLVLQLADSNFMIYDRHSMELKHASFVFAKQVNRTFYNNLSVSTENKCI